MNAAFGGHDWKLTGLDSALHKSLGLELELRVKFPRVFRACTQSGKAVPAGS